MSCLRIGLVVCTGLSVPVCASLEELNISSNKLTSTKGIEAVPLLRTLNLSSNKVFPFDNTRSLSLHHVVEVLTDSCDCDDSRLWTLAGCTFSNTSSS